MSTWINNTQRQAFERALDVSNSGTTLLQTFINRTVQQLTLREFGLQSVLDRRRGTGNAEYINQRTAATSGGAWVSDSNQNPAAYAEQGSYAQVNFPYQTLLTQGAVTRKLQATGRTYSDILALQMAMKAEDFANYMETSLLVGRNGTNAFGNNMNSTEAISGFLTKTVLPESQYISMNNSATPAALNINSLDKAIDKVKGSSRRSDLVIVGSHKGLRTINGLLQAAQQFTNETEIAAGFRVRTYDGIPLVASTSMPNNILIDSTGGKIDGYSGASTAILVLNKRYCYLSELTPMTVMPLANSTSQQDAFDMFWDGALVVSNPLGCSLICNIA